MNFDSFSFFDGTSMTPVTQVTWADYWKGIIPDGVVGGVANEMRVYANSTGLKVFVDTGACIVDNHRGVISSEKELTIAAAHASKPRIDIVVARVVYGNENASKMELAVKKGTAATNPVAPSVTQVTGGTYEVKLAEVYVAANVVTITAENVTDFRNLFTAGRQAVGFLNADTEPLEKGMLVTLSGTVSDAVVRCKVGRIPVGVVQSDYIGVGARGQIETHPGAVAEIKCSSDKIAVGDALVQSDTLGIARAGSGFAGGLALTGKTAGAVGNVRSLLTFFSKLPTQNKWYLPTGMQESNVICAFQFVGALSENDALMNINENGSYTLAKAGAVTWNPNKGFYIYNKDSGLVNGDISDQYASVASAALGYAFPSNPTGNDSISLNMSQGKRILSPFTYTYYAQRPKYLLIRNGASGIKYVNINSLSGHLSGVLSGDFSSQKVYLDGLAQTMTASADDQRDYENDILLGSGPGETMPTAYLTAAVLYSVQLDAGQHAELAENIRALGGM